MAKKITSYDELLRAFMALPASERAKFVRRMPAKFAFQHPDVEEKIRRLEIKLSDLHQSFGSSIRLAISTRARIPKKKGKPERDAIIVRLAETKSDAAVGRDDAVVAANDGKRMKPEAVQQVRLKYGVKKGRRNSAT